MTYFTPELLRRVHSEDPEVAALAHDEWERAIARCKRRWEKIKAAFPEAVRRFEEEQVCLHDAQLLGMGQQDVRFVMLLQPEPPSQDLVLLTFILDGEPAIETAALPGCDKLAGYVEWMYEEFDLDRRGKNTFEVLLSNGWSVRLPFRDFQYLIAQRLFPIGRTGSDSALPPAQPLVPRSA